MFSANECLDVTHSALCHDKVKRCKSGYKSQTTSIQQKLAFVLIADGRSCLFNLFSHITAEKRRTVNRSDRLG